MSAVGSQRSVPVRLSRVTWWRIPKGATPYLFGALRLLPTTSVNGRCAERLCACW